MEINKDTGTREGCSVSTDREALPTDYKQFYDF